MGVPALELGITPVASPCSPKDDASLYPLYCLPSKLLHKRVGDKGETQEENFLPKYQRVKDLCQRAEFQTACEQLGQVRG